VNKKIILMTIAAFAVVSIFGAACGKAYAKEYKIGYVDLARVFDEYKKTKESEKTLEEKGKAKDAERKKMVDELRRLKDEQAILSEKAKAEKQAIIDTKIKNLQEFDKSARDEIVKQRNDLLNNIMKEIEGVVTTYAKETGYDIILNSRTILYGADQFDLTNDILSRLNK